MSVPQPTCPKCGQYLDGSQEAYLERIDELIQDLQRLNAVNREYRDVTAKARELCDRERLFYTQPLAEALQRMDKNCESIMNSEVSS